MNERPDLFNNGGSIFGHDLFESIANQPDLQLSHKSISFGIIATSDQERERS